MTTSRLCIEPRAGIEDRALGLAIAAVVLVSGSLGMNEIVQTQAGPGFLSVIPNFNLIVTGFIPFVVFIIAVFALG